MTIHADTRDLNNLFFSHVHATRLGGEIRCKKFICYSVSIAVDLNCTSGIIIAPAHIQFTYYILCIIIFNRG